MENSYQEDRSRNESSVAAREVRCGLSSAFRHIRLQGHTIRLMQQCKARAVPSNSLNGAIDILCGERSRLKEDAVPSVFPFKKDSHGESPRQKRQRTRETRSVIQDSQPPEDVQSEVVIESTPLSASSEVFMAGTCTLPTSTSTQSTQCDINSLGKFTVENFRNNAKMINYYTGFIDYAQFMLFYHCLGPCVSELGHLGSILDPRDQLFMVLMKLRQAKEDVELSLFFQVSESTVSRIVVTWINFLYFQLKELDIWPSREILQEYMPVDFKRKFPNTRVILDATELPIQKPSEVNAQSVTWSAYKHKNTLKAMIGCTPRGVVSFVSDAYGGSASDRQIIENSSLLHQSMFDKGDSIMADRGIMVQDLFATKDVYVNTPTMLKGKSQLDPEEVVNDRRVASKRIHIERIIGLSKGFKILKKNCLKANFNWGHVLSLYAFRSQISETASLINMHDSLYKVLSGIC